MGDKGQSEGMVCVGCRQPVRKGASIETMSWSKYGGLIREKDGRVGWAVGPSIMISYHARCSKRWEGLAGRKRLLAAVERHLRRRPKFVLKVRA